MNTYSCTVCPGSNDEVDRDGEVGEGTWGSVIEIPLNYTKRRDRERKIKRCGGGGCRDRGDV